MFLFLRVVISLGLDMYSKKIGIAICSKEEVEQSFKDKEAGMFLKQLLEYLEKLGKKEDRD